MCNYTKWRNEKNLPQTNPEEWLKINFFIHIGVCFLDDGLDLILGEHLAKGFQSRKNRQQISHSDPTTFILLVYGLTGPRQMVSCDSPKSWSSSAKLFATKNSKKKWGMLTPDLRVRSSTWVNWLWSHGSDTSTPTKPAITGLLFNVKTNHDPLQSL